MLPQAPPSPPSFAWRVFVFPRGGAMSNVYAQAFVFAIVFMGLWLAAMFLLP
jgi:hypothetical protein